MLATVLLFAAAAGAAAGLDWRQKPPAEWTQEEALAVLTDSPWGQSVALVQTSGRTLAVFSDGLKEIKAVYQEGPGAPPREFRCPPPRPLNCQPDRIEQEMVRAVYGVRWSSAQAVQQALARLGELSSLLRDLQAPPPELSAEHYVVTVRVMVPPSETPLESLAREPLTDEQTGRPVYDRPPSVPDIFAGLTDDELRARAELQTAARLRLKPERAVRHGAGAGEGISFFFPRQQDGRPTLAPGTAWAEFVFESDKGDKLKARFRLGEMKRDGKPDY